MRLLVFVPCTLCFVFPMLALRGIYGLWGWWGIAAAAAALVAVGVLNRWLSLGAREAYPEVERQR